MENRKYNDIFECDKDTDITLLDKYCEDVDFVFHLAGVNRPKDESEFMEGNFEFTSKLLEILRENPYQSPPSFKKLRGTSSPF